MTALLKEVENRDLRDVIVNISSCAGLCSREPMMTVELQGEPPVKYVDLTPDKARDILEKHVIGGQVVKEYALAVGEERAL
jgi:NADP-reducing hydrogenase subunit HndB